jgi:uncharacterized protein
MTALRRSVISLLSICGGVYLVLSVYLYARQMDFIFFPQREIISAPKDYGCNYVDVGIPSGSGHLHGWMLPERAGAEPPFAGKTLLYLHGNGGNVGANSEHACRLNKLGFAVLLFDYRGYGQSDAPPRGGLNEDSIYADAEAGWRYLRSDPRVPAANIVLYGHSLGGAVAVEMAKRHPDAGALVVESSFTSLYNMADRDPVFRYFPIRLILHQKMESEEKLRSIVMPTLIVHGVADSLVPSTMAEKLHSASAATRKQLFLVPRAGHENVAEMAGTGYGKRIAALLGP